jgi:signal peptidase I
MLSRPEMSQPHTIKTTVTVLLALAGFVLVSCGGTSKTASTTTTASLSHERVVANPPASNLHNRRYRRAQRKFLACMRTNDVNYSRAGQRSAEKLETLANTNTFRKAILQCYPPLAAALPKTAPGFLPQRIRKIAAFYEASRAHVISYRVPSGSMQPTLEVGAFAFYKPLSGSPRIGQIVVFNPPRGAEQEDCGPTAHLEKVGGRACEQPVPRRSTVKFIKRIVAGPGDEIYIKRGHVYRNGIREPDSYIKPCGSLSGCDFPVPIKIGPGHWFVMGDNRGESDDSRFWGPIPTSWILGVVQSCSAIGHPCAGN